MVMDWIRDLYWWTQDATWRTWVFHALIALAFAPIVGAWTMMVVFVFREGEQVWSAWIDGRPQDWRDHFLDLSAPFVALGLASLFGWGA